MHFIGDTMELNKYFKCIIDSDLQPIVICNTQHDIIYMNFAAVQRYSKYGEKKLIGRSIFACHNERSCKIIKSVVEWFNESTANNRVYTFHNVNDNRDVYMIALRDDIGKLIGYYEKHESRQPETTALYDMK